MIDLAILTTARRCTPSSTGRASGLVMPIQLRLASNSNLGSAVTKCGLSFLIAVSTAVRLASMNEFEKPAAYRGGRPSSSLSRATSSRTASNRVKETAWPLPGAPTGGAPRFRRCRMRARNAPNPWISMPNTRASASSEAISKLDQILNLLRRKNGTTLNEMQKVSGWQAHSVRGFLSGTVKKKLELKLQSTKSKDGVRRYSISAN